MILPQVWTLVLPPLANVAVATLKLTAILGIIAVTDLTKALISAAYLTEIFTLGRTP